MVADASEEFCLALADLLRENFQVRVCMHGDAAWQMLREYQPNILVLDLMLPGLDGLSLLQMAAAAQCMPKTLVTTCLINDYVTAWAEKLKVKYIMVKPCHAETVAMRVGDLARETPLVPPDPRDCVLRILMELGIPVKRKGFACLWEAVLLMSRDMSQQLTKELYPAVAKVFSTSSQQVERAIRSAIEIAWENRNKALWACYFPADANGDVAKPTNGEMILRLAGILLEEQNRNAPQNTL